MRSCSWSILSGGRATMCTGGILSRIWTSQCLSTSLLQLHQRAGPLRPLWQGPVRGVENSKGQKRCLYTSLSHVWWHANVQVYNHMYDWFIMGSRCIFTKWDQTSIITIMMPHFASYKTPFFAVYQLLGAGVYHKKVKLIHHDTIPSSY